MPKIILAVSVCTALAALSCTQDNGCEDALNHVTTAMSTVCSTAPYDTSSFCKTCVSAGYFSTTGPTDCRCKTLAFDQSSCTVPSQSDVEAQVRGAVNYAIQSCGTYQLPSADAGSNDGARTASDSGPGG